MTADRTEQVEVSTGTGSFSHRRYFLSFIANESDGVLIILVPQTLKSHVKTSAPPLPILCFTKRKEAWPYRGEVREIKIPLGPYTVQVEKLNYNIIRNGKETETIEMKRKTFM